jgi:uncharacterized protein (TIGR02598 family)
MMTLSRTNKGFSLVEITIALGIAAFCLLSIFALLPTGMNTNRSSVDETIGANLAAAIVADLRATPIFATGATTNSPTYGLDPDTDTGGTPHTLYLKESGEKGSSGADSDYIALISVTKDKTVATTKAIDIQIQAPAAAKIPHTVFEAWTALDRK